MLLRHKSTVMQKTKNFNRRKGNSITEETQDFDLKKESSFSSPTNLGKGNDLNYSSLNSFLPPVNKSNSQLANHNDNIRSSSLYFEDTNPNSNLQVFRSLNKEKQIINEHTNRKNDSKAGRPKTQMNFNQRFSI